MVGERRASWLAMLIAEGVQFRGEHSAVWDRSVRLGARVQHNDHTYYDSVFAVRGCQRHAAVDRRSDPRTSTLRINIVARFIPFSVLSFWVKSTGICAGTMPYRRDFTATTRI